MFEWIDSLGWCLKCCFIWKSSVKRTNFQLNSTDSEIWRTCIWPSVKETSCEKICGKVEKNVAETALCSQSRVTCAAPTHMYNMYIIISSVCNQRWLCFARSSCNYIPRTAASNRLNPHRPAERASRGEVEKKAEKDWDLSLINEFCLSPSVCARATEWGSSVTTWSNTHGVTCTV